MYEYMKTILNAIRAWIKSEYRKSTDEEIIDILIEEDAISAVKDRDGFILSIDEDIIIW